MRDNKFLEGLLEDMVHGPYSSMQVVNKITIRFGRRAKRRFGSIKMTPDKRVSHITINGIFKNEFIPEEVILATLAHELAHYAHGFCSPLPQKYKHPHKGGVIKKEMKARGLLHLYEFEKKWTKENWSKVVASQLPTTNSRPRRRVRRRQVKRQPLRLIDLLRLAIRQR